MSICKQLNQFFSDAFRNGDEVSFRFEKVWSFECKEQVPVSGKQQVDIKLFLKPADPPVPGDRFHDPYEKKLQLFLQPKTVFRSIRVDRFQSTNVQKKQSSMMQLTQFILRIFLRLLLN